MDPLSASLQSILFTVSSLIVNPASGWVNVILLVSLKQPLASVTLTLYVPAGALKV